ncbi:patatin-like phospholipase family protein [Ilumatobacter sp.]|uniref:patatin-like phospholipase family protein n=1 Tax=Ilumatobacter sp. TaxID=1967498 RepID=UPI003AF972C0
MARTSTRNESPTVAVVLSGAAARGAFQAGALAALMPELERRGERPSILLGTSAGAINAALWGANAHLPSADAADGLVELWSEMGADDVYEPISRSVWPLGVRFLLGSTMRVGGGTTSLLDTGPLRDTAGRRFDAERLHANVVDASVGIDAVGVVATRVPPGEERRDEGMASGRSVLFLDERVPSGYVGDPAHAHDVVASEIGPEHVVASAAIPVAFPAQRIDTPESAAGWYVDGGVRLNAPLRHAIGLGADRIILVSAASTEHGPPFASADPSRRPDMAYAGAQALHAVLSDRMIEDLHAIRRMNHLVEQVEQAAPSGGLQELRRRGSKDVYRRVEFMRVSPPPGAMGMLAGQLSGERADLHGAAADSDNFLLARAVRGAGDAKGYRELMSYLLFDEEYFQESIRIGRDAACKALLRGWEH